MIKSENDTIVAIATPIGIAAILVIRISGEKAIDIIDSIFKGRNNLKNVPSHTIHYGKIYDNNGNIIDDVLVSIFRAPNSYTGENSCEISTHGNPFIAQKIVNLILEKGARIAEPGEFTKRAFLNGKLDLAQAEAVVDVIEASTEASLRGARNQLDGILSTKINQLREELIEIISLTELELDFAEEDIDIIPSNEIHEKINTVLEEINSLLETYKFGKIIKDGVNTAIVGKPNVGKSSLLNYLLKENRAIVSHIPGTTRDVIREDINIEGILFRFYDTAGIRDTNNEIEKEGVRRSREVVKSADLVLFMNDIQDGVDEDIYKILLKLTEKDKIIRIMNKIDIIDNNIKEKKLSEIENIDISISAKTGEGIKELCNLLKIKALGTFSYTEHSAVVSNIRHYNSLKKAKEYLLNALTSLKKRMTEEFIATDLRMALSSLEEIIGLVTTDDILNNIFSRFCIGK